jgi:hypothetical protein
LTVQDLTTQASNKFITSYLQALDAANAVRHAHSQAIVESANGDPTEYREMAKSGTILKMIVADVHEFVAQLSWDITVVVARRGAVCRYLPIA